MTGLSDDATNFNSQLGSGWVMHYALQQKQEQYILGTFQKGIFLGVFLWSGKQQ